MRPRGVQHAVESCFIYIVTARAMPSDIAHCQLRADVYVIIRYCLVEDGDAFDYSERCLHVERLSRAFVMALAVVIRQLHTLIMSSDITYTSFIRRHVYVVIIITHCLAKMVG